MKNSFYANTELIGLLGFPIKQSYSPFIHNVAAELTGTKVLYLPFEVHSSNLKDAVKGMVALGIRGFNVTVPHKVKVLDYLNKSSEEVTVIGAANTIVNDLGKLTGYNTDVHGINVSLTPYKSEINGNDVAIFGSGGSARAVIYTLLRYYKPKKIFLINRTEDHSESLKQHFKNKMRFDAISTKALNDPNSIDLLNSCSLIVNATPVGMYPNDGDSIISLPQVFVKDQVVFDLVYNPVKTKFLQLAEANGAKIIGGLTMLVEQAGKSFTLWTNKEFPTEKVQKALLLYLSK
ncbi:MAG TPA: shikimate dehydrogenase [Ignavibacteriaceae bacterium]|nr:shikimate dehydrogenase [Ignavibacteriaceae bacterium]